jgi:hypothetical protein
MSVEPHKQKGVNTIVFTSRSKGHTETQFYDVIIEFYPTEIHQNIFQKPSYDNPVWVTCGCPYWHYFCQYAVAKIGSTTFVQFQGDHQSDSMKPPMIRNRNITPYLCKHLYSAAPKCVVQAVKVAAKESKGKYKFT